MHYQWIAYELKRICSKGVDDVHAARVDKIFRDILMRREYPYRSSKETPCLRSQLDRFLYSRRIASHWSNTVHKHIILDDSQSCEGKVEHRAKILYYIGQVAIYTKSSISTIDNTYRSMAATHTLQKEVDRNFDFFDTFLTLNELPRREEDDPVSESCSSTRDSTRRPEYTKSFIAENRAGCASPVEAWINKEFGDDEDASQAMHDEADSYTTLIRQVDEYIDTVDFVHGTPYSIYGNHVDADVLYQRVDSDDVEMFYEPQLWCFI